MNPTDRSLRVALTTLAICVTALAPVAHATLLVARSLTDQVSAADHIVVVTGISETSRWDRFGRIVSDMRLHVTDVIKGPLNRGDDVSVMRLGGSIGDLGMTVAGEAIVAPGERAILFLDDVDDQGTMRVSNMSLGQYPVTLRHGVPTVLPSGAGLALVVQTPGGALVPTVSPLPAPISLAEFLSVLRELAAGTR